MDRQTQNANEEMLQLLMDCYGGAQRLADELATLDCGAADAVTPAQAEKTPVSSRLIPFLSCRQITETHWRR